MVQTDALRALFEQHFHRTPDSVERVRELLGGSGRRILRLRAGETTAIGILHQVRKENETFLALSRHFRQHSLPVAEIYAADLDRNIYLEEDLGDLTLFDFLRENRNGNDIGPDVVEAYRKVVTLLPRFQVDAGRDLDYEVCHPRHSFDRQSIAWDLNYFKYHFLKLSEVEFDEQALEDDFDRLIEFLLEADRDYFLYRDFQSRNVMLRDGNPFFIDYQGGRRGALQYDIASLLYDAKADLPPTLRQELLEAYLDALGGRIDLDRDRFMRHYYGYVYVRIMQAMGAYGFRGFFERKPLFLESVPYALGNIRWLLHNAVLPVELPALFDAFRGLLDSEKLQSLDSGSGTMTVRVFSFSFHEKPPDDESGHGGGFVFDARSLPNPGREERYRELTGQDAVVADYLTAQPAVADFVASVTSLVDLSVASYRRRGFQHLMVSFGCTGGQHRSVYLAERMGEHLRRKPGVEVVVRHLVLEKRNP